jgi:glutaredoxin 3
MFTIYSKGESCKYCVKAKELLKERSINYKEVLIPQDISKDDLQSSIVPWIDQRDLTVPQIFLNGEIGSQRYIGGYDNLVEFLKNRIIEKIDFSNMEI